MVCVSVIGFEDVEETMDICLGCCIFDFLFVFLVDAYFFEVGVLPSIECRDRQKAKESCMKTFVEKYDMVTDPSGEGQGVKEEMTVQVEQSEGRLSTRLQDGEW